MRRSKPRRCGGAREGQAKNRLNAASLAGAMPRFMARLNIALIGCGGIALQNHLPGFELCPDVAVTALCDSDAAALERARRATGTAIVSTLFEEIVARED